MKAFVRTLARRTVCMLRPATLVLAYHHVAAAGQAAPWVTVSPERFAEQMAYLAASRLVVPMDQLLADVRRGRVPSGGHVVVTFDDAALDTCTTALPILRRHSIPATLFVPTGLVGRAGPFWWDRLYRLDQAAAARELELAALLIDHGALEDGPEWTEDTIWRRLRQLDPTRRDEAFDRVAERLGEDEAETLPGAMSWEQIAELDASGLITLGAHTVGHPMLASLADEPLKAEMEGSRDALAGFRSFRKVFAYPYGDTPAIGARVEEAVRQAGFEAAFTTSERALTGKEAPMALGRVCVDEMSIEEFRWAIDHHLGP
jgi:peptidoglycan/xylan/chitin deacetylase (PgdA/CDA1 family)